MDLNREGFVVFDSHSPFDECMMSPVQEFPWLKNATNRTLKIEVSTPEELVVMRFLHTEKFSDMAYARAYLEIANSFFQVTKLNEGEIE